MLRIALLSALALTLSSVALAAEPQLSPECRAKQQKQTGGLQSESTYHVLERVAEDIGKKRWADAEDRLLKLQEHASDYEKALINYNLGFIYNAQDNFSKSLRAFQSALDSHALPLQQEEQLKINVGQLYVANNQYDKGIRVLEDFIATACYPVSADTHIFLGNAYAEKKRYTDALRQVEIALSLTDKPQESWLQLKLGLHYELKQFSKAVETLIQLIAMAPDKDQYWKQLSGILYEIKEDKSSLAVLAVAENNGFLQTGSEYKNLANIYMLLGIPYKAGRLWDEAISKGLLPANDKNLEQMSNAWISAREYDRAEAALKRAAAVSDRGDLYFRLGQVYVQDENWKDALAMLEKAADKGVESKKRGELAFLTGVAAYNSGNLKRAESALEKAMQYDDQRKNASQWLAQLRQKQAAGTTAQAGQ